MGFHARFEVGYLGLQLRDFRDFSQSLFPDVLLFKPPSP